MKPLLHTVTQRQIDAALQNTPQALGISGPKGSGKSFVAKYIKNELSSLNSTSKEESILTISPNDKNVITIEDARKVVKFLHLKSASNASRRIAVIEDAQTMTDEAQNALLKVIEEPPANTTIILTYTGETSILPTIQSRIQSISLKRVSANEFVNHYKNEYPEDELKKAFRIAGGRIGLAIAVTNDTEHELIKSISTAKEIISKNTYERLCMVDSLSKQDIRLLLEGLNIVAEAGFTASVSGSNRAKTNKLQDIRSSVFDAIENLSHNPNSKLLLTDLVLKI